jgi:probable F420-dependent oxidoreductase
VRWIFQYPDTRGVDGDMLDAGPLGEVAAAVEAAGWDGLALTEHPAPGARWLSAGGHQTLDPFVALGYAAAVTERIRLLTYLAVLPYRNPLLVAKAATTLDRLSNGRFVLGVGVGYLKSEFHALGVDFDERNELFDEALEVIPLHWSGEPFTYEGRHFSARDVAARPRPVQDPIPIWIGGNSARARQRAADRAQGWMPLTSAVDISATTRSPHIASTAELARLVRDLHERAGARAGELDVVAVYADPTIGAPGRDVDRHRAALAGLADAGATWIVVPGPPSTSLAATLTFIDEFATTYIHAEGATP